MPWHIAKSSSCPASEPWAVIKDADGKVVGCHPSQDAAKKQLAALYAQENKVEAMDKEVRTFPFEIEEVRAAENGRSKDFTIKGHAAVYNTWTDLGPFRERVAEGAFEDVLAGDPHVLHLIDHDTRYVLSSTRNKTLELTSDPAGLLMWSKVAPTSYAADLRVLMERGDVSQSSFAFTVDKDEWNDEAEDGVPERTITKVGHLFDVTTTAMGAYPTTDSQVAARTLERARELARELPERNPAETTPGTAPFTVAVGGAEPPLDSEAGFEDATTVPKRVARADADLRLLKRRLQERLDAARRLRDEIGKVIPSYEDYKEDRRG